MVNHIQNILACFHQVRPSQPIACLHTNQATVAMAVKETMMGGCHGNRLAQGYHGNRLPWQVIAMELEDRPLNKMTAMAIVGYNMQLILFFLLYVCTHRTCD